MKKLYMGVLLVGTALVAGCGKGNDAQLEKGQVVATVGGKDVTIHELNAELQGVQLPAGADRKQTEQAVLQQVVQRKILADIARERGLDKTPMFLIQQKRAEETLLAQLLQRQLASSVKQPTAQEVQTFIAQNPDLFAERKIFNIDQIQFETPKDPRALLAYQPFKTMAEVEAQLKKDGLRYRRAPAVLDVATANPELVQRVLKLPAGEIFIIPGGGAVIANQIIGQRVEPLAGDQANQLATSLIQQRKFADLTKRDLEPKVKKARDEVKYQGGYAPPKPAGAPAAAPAAK
ncbi:peptidyl-prolyl cis-trans isomerase, EpsD family [Sphingomonas changnyeongensis]|uniref:Peptidyl-prolyl cis-trans isomerase, EpsD family n=1 Tax=Sphingomonas changnyeongensis TaxID=2698679 RepID=A0A7Z2S8S5_9SPHN|nr:peptidyl-prolyl cis-trans isomerase, EpsD family [Sphingomonas changnyeongensis]QHL90119.1 peptidyl-prolyl cis-trans isomerase, EpsD family [Sphingomonas changnyeongensis]